MDLEGTVPSDTSQTEKDQYCMLSLICGLLKIKQISNITKRKETHRYKLVVSSGERKVGRRVRQGCGIESYNLLCKIYKLQRYVVQHGEHSQYFTITISGL